MNKTFDPTAIEAYWGEFWEKQQLFTPSGKGQPYCIMLPPPNVTGTLHMGHGFQQTIMDCLIRYHRMRGENTLWQGGADHAGIATQMVVERQLAQTDTSRHDIGRSQFIEKVWQWREESGHIISKQMHRLGLSIDWQRYRFTMDPQLTQATQHAFIELYKQGLIYRGKRLVNWDPKLKTAISDLEVEMSETQGHLWTIRYPLVESDESITIATTRPETMLGDTAIAVHPKDERYAHLIGQQVHLPLTERSIPIIADEQVDQDFGSGCVKVTPAHDFNDYAIGQRHQLPMINIFTLDGHMNNEVPKAYQGLERFSARERILTDLQQAGLLVNTQEHTLSIPKGDRSGVVIEPMLTDQWFIKMQSLAKPAIEAVNKKQLQFVPATWSKNYCQWLNNIQDWCISRQLWWGHRIPAWYDEQGNVYVGTDEETIRQQHKLPKHITLSQDEDVLDTWFTSSLWPFATLGWPAAKSDFKTFYPTQVLVSGFDIIFFWIARMVMMGLHFTKKVPFHEVYITGLIRDSHGKKMSKSKGNIIDPIDLIDGISLTDLIAKRTQGLMQPQMAAAIEKNTREDFPDGIAAYGTDALRFTFCALASSTRDINFDMGRISGYRNFCNKIWNAARYVLLNTENHNLAIEQAHEYSIADRWILSQLQSLIQQTHQHIQKYRFDLLAQSLYEFIWNEYCDWYLELAKCTFNNTSASNAQLRGTRLNLLEILETILRLIHPIMPFISEEIWQKVAELLGKSSTSIMQEAYPEHAKNNIDKTAEQHIHWLKQVTVAIRTIRSEMNISPAIKIPVIFHKGTTEDQHHLANCQDYLCSLAKIDKISWTQEQNPPPASATAVIQQLEIHIPLSGLIDKKAELNRLNKEINKLQKELDKSSKKLANNDYLNKAPSTVVQKERERHQQHQLALDKLQQQCASIQSL